MINDDPRRELTFNAANGKTPSPNGDRMRDGLIGSFALHLLGFALIVYLLLPGHHSAPRLIIVPIEVKQIGLNGRPPGPPALLKTSISRPPAPVAATRRKVAPRNPVRHSTANPRPAAARLQHKAPDSLLERLERFAKLRQPPSPSRLAAPGPDHTLSGEGNGAGYRVRDYIRSQIERRWVFDSDALDGANWSVTLHIEISPEGNVESAQIIETPRFHTDDAYRSFALSARNAALLSSPITIPPGTYHIARDVFLTFSSRQVLQ